MIGRVRLLFVPLLLCSCDQLFELDEVTAPDGAPDGVGGCPIDYTLTSTAAPDSRYKFVGVPVTWREAANDCASHASGRTHLAVIASEFERETLDDMATNFDVWVGMTDIVIEGTHVWVTLEPAPIAERSVEPWAQDKPDDSTGGQDCVRMNDLHAFLLDDHECETLSHYVCECDNFANDPSRYDP